ncbi:hypothetical protein Ocin01_17582 [Orchesella cincta]|uniref:Uncharacterized protein n=1 Tax=Orchesella cincta TaxID=48709 RepID=A0A1D2M800_ORCCI|nr:hypothetical protein Ocin01_17582 [Orchesella cincta]
MVLPHLIPFFQSANSCLVAGVSRGSKVALDKSLQDTWTSSSKLFHSHFDTFNQISSLLSEIKKISTQLHFQHARGNDQFAKAVGLQLDGDLAVSSTNPFLIRSLSVNLEPPPGGERRVSMAAGCRRSCSSQQASFPLWTLYLAFLPQLFPSGHSSVAKLRSYLTRLPTSRFSSFPERLCLGTGQGS